jgi:hypothetical protein
MPIGCTAPAPMPWMARAAISTGMDHAAPESTEPSRNTPMPKNITGLRPRTSANFPYSGTVTAWVSR